jgi:hypothetical protein
VSLSTALKEAWNCRILLVAVPVLFFSAKGIGATTEDDLKHELAKYPRVSEAMGASVGEKIDGKSVALKAKDVLRERALLRVGEKAQLKIELDSFSSLTLTSGSVVELPVITWGEGEVFEVKLEKGKIFYECEKNCKRYVSTPLSREVFVNGEYWLEYVPESPRVELLVQHGTQDFRGLENEESVNLQAGQKVVFQGLKENGEVAYDELLRGRKVARGKMQPVVTIPENEFNKLVKDFQVKREALKKALTPVKPKPTAKQICKEPFAELNQCFWICEGLKKGQKTCDLTKKGLRCLRRRCNANGEWTDPADSKACDLSPKVGPCDY